MKKLIVLLFLMFLLALHISYAEELDVLELHGADLQINLDDVQASAEWADDNILVDAAEYDITLGELEYADSNEVVPNIVAQNEYGEIAIDQEHFPDANFREYIVANIDTDGNGYLSESERLAVTILEVYNMKISDLEGIAFFSELKKLSCSDNFLTELDVSKNLKLEELECEKNKINELSVGKNTNLVSLTCYDNAISQLDVTGCSKLKLLDCSDNKLKKLDISMCYYIENLSCYNNALESLELNMNVAILDCSDNSLSSLEVSYNTGLEWFECANNNITSLTIRDCSKLWYLSCSNNKLTSLKIGKCPKLGSLFCYNNDLKSLDVSKCTALYMLYCNDNSLTSLDVSKCTKLYKLKCNGNKLSKLKLGKNPISDLYCELNKLKTVDIGGCSDLMGEVTSIIGDINTNWGVIAWGSEYDDYDGRERGNGYIRIDKSTTLKNGKKILYKPGNPKSIKFTRSSGTLKKGSYINLGKYLKMSPSGVASVCKLTSSNKKVVKVDNYGYAYGVKKGTATITVKTANGKKAKIKIKVK